MEPGRQDPYILDDVQEIQKREDENDDLVRHQREVICVIFLCRNKYVYKFVSIITLSVSLHAYVNSDR